MDYADMVANVLPKVRGCPEAVAINAMREACIEWCRDTYALVTGITGLSSGASADVSLSEEVVIDILDARIAGEQIDVVHANSDALLDADADNQMLVFADPQEPMLVPAPAVATEVELLVALAPGATSTEIPDALWRRDHQALEHGCLARLYEEPGNGWSDDTRAVFYGGRFDIAKTRAAAHYGKNRQTKAQRLRVKAGI